MYSLFIVFVSQSRSESKALLFARQKIVEPYDVPPDFKVDTRLKEIGWDVELKGYKYNE